ncbi:hypothetical protein ZYGR_0N00100 [Zygosaccharomyces rouxii]|uniref:IPT/TIG domain-containing protein n=1 Tax=Zygosaccharomyces rouxii TaxID=4956 RepID=A0A1Q2ZYT6_ZYGRO|nr:hypothetical protein ZYGR_0N00100 [Zygosaccharomyces rouxii]
MLHQVKNESLFPIGSGNGNGEDVNMLESDLLDDFMFGRQDRPDDEDAIFNSFIKTDQLEDPTAVVDGRIFNKPVVEEQQEEVPFVSSGEEQAPASPLQEPQQPKSPPLTTSDYEKHCQELVDHSLVFGRTEPLHTAYVNPLDYLHIDGNSLPYQLQISGLPDVSRVENQIKLELRVSPPVKQCMIHLPTDCIARHKFYLEKDVSAYPQEFQDQLLFAEAFLLCSSNDKNTYVCTRCVKREHRRASRRKSGLSDNMLWCNNENRRAIIFNNKQVFVAKGSDGDSTQGDKTFELTARVVCYCRHHKSPDGFKILFVLKNSKGEVLAKTVSSNIMIMDKKPQLNSSESVGNIHSNANSNNNMDSGADTATELFSNTNFGEFPTTTSASEYNSNNINVVTNSGAPSVDMESTPGKYFSMGELSPPPGGLEMPDGNDNPPDGFNGGNISDHLVARGVMPSPTSMSEDGSESYLSAMDRRRTSGPLGSGSAAYARTKNYQRKRPRHDTAMDDGEDGGSWSSSSVGIISGKPVVTQRPSTSGPTQTTQEDCPSIQRVIPSQGPINGGIEITLLGSKFKDGLVVKFGENVALSTQCWSETTMVTCLPPASCAGQVFVTVINPAGSSNNAASEVQISNQATFTYMDDTDRQLIELALQIVGLKMNGKLEDARNIAKRIVGNDDSPKGNSPSLSTGNDNNAGGSIQDAFDNKLMYSDENLLVKVIRSLHVNSNLSMCDSLGRTLLQLASLKGYHTLCSVLIKKGARVNDRDSFGFSPLHFACVGGDTKVIRLLLQCKADPTVKAHNGVSCKQLFVVNHGTKKDNYQYVEDVLRIFDEFNQSNSFSKPMRKLSDASFNSSLYDTESLDSLDAGNGPVQASGAVGEYSASDHEESELEEDGDEDLLAEDDSPIPVTSAQPVGTSDDNAIDHSNTQAMDGKLLNKMLSYLNEGLPKYEDLYPNSPQDDANKLREVSRDNNDRPGSTAEESQNSSEDEEDALQLRLNRFFQQRQNFQNDKMLLFFWLPLTVVLLSWYALFKFGQDGDYVHYFSNMVAEQLRVLLAKIILGNERMKTAFKEQLTMFQNTNILSVNAE